MDNPPAAPNLQTPQVTPPQQIPSQTPSSAPSVPPATQKTSFFKFMPANDVQRIAYASWCLRLGLAFVFTFAAISMSLNPKAYIHYVPLFLRQVFPGYNVLHAIGVFEIILSVWLLWGKKLMWAAIVSACMMFGITVFNLDSFSILFRNVAIFFGAVSLIVLAI